MYMQYNIEYVDDENMNNILLWNLNNVKNVLRVCVWPHLVFQAGAPHKHSPL